MFKLFLLLLSHSIFLASSCPNGWVPSKTAPGKCYMFVEQAQTYLDAEYYCKSIAADGHLTSIASAFENNEIFSKENFDCPQFWIGLNDIVHTGKFAWLDGQPVQYTNWFPGQPNVAVDKQCVSMDGETDGKWVTEFGGVSNCFVCETYQSSVTTTASTPMTDCYDWYHIGGARDDGVYQVRVPGLTNPLAVWCDMTTDGGGWTVFQRRIDDGITFHDKTWHDYKYGFNNGFDTNLWLGNEYIHLLSTKDANVDLRIDIVGDRTPNSKYLNVYLWQKQSSFYLDSEANNYTLHVNTAVEGNASFSGSANAGISYNIGLPFSTIDNHHDNCNGCCTQTPNDLSGWWLNGCAYSSLNGKYIPSGWASHVGYSWYTGNYYINPAHSTMMLRRAP